MTCHYPDLGSDSDRLKICFTQSEALTRSRQLDVISVEFLRSFLRLETVFLLEVNIDEIIMQKWRHDETYTSFDFIRVYTTT